MSYKIKVVKSDQDVYTSDPRDDIFNSDNPPIKIYEDETVSVTVNAGSSTVISVAHGLTFVAMCWVFVELAPGHFYSGVCIPSQADGFPSAYLSVSPNPAETYVDSTYLKIKINNTTAVNKTIKVNYCIFGDDGL